MHIKHVWERKGWEERGSFTKTYWKCNQCSSRFDTFKTGRPEDFVWWVEFLLVSAIVLTPVTAYILLNLK